MNQQSILNCLCTTREENQNNIWANLLNASINMTNSVTSCDTGFTRSGSDLSIQSIIVSLGAAGLTPLCPWTLSCPLTQLHNFFLDPLGKDGGCLDPTWSFGQSVTIWWRVETLPLAAGWLGHYDA